jgi:hypothetical protein
MHIFQIVSGFTKIVKLLTKLTEEKQALKWTPQKEAFVM